MFVWHLCHGWWNISLNIVIKYDEATCSLDAFKSWIQTLIDTHSKLVLSVQIAHITEASFKICMKQVDTNQLNKVKQIVSIQLCYKYWASFSNLFTLKIHIGISPPPRHHLMYRPMHRPMHGPACQPKPQSCPTKPVDIRTTWHCCCVLGATQEK